MSLVVINAVTVSEEGRADFEARFAARAGTVSSAAGFEAFELMRELEGGRYLVYTRWSSEQAFRDLDELRTVQRRSQPTRGTGPGFGRERGIAVRAARVGAA